eukprot:267925-Lingulodinium_polyedra.AAC.1
MGASRPSIRPAMPRGPPPGLLAPGLPQRQRGEPRFALELFAGQGGLTAALASAGVSTLPPVELRSGL